MNEVCGDNRFELIAKYRQKLIDATNIETSPDEMKVLDNILFRMWQMGWLNRWESGSTSELKELREWAVKKAAMYDKKINERPHQYSAYVNRERYEFVIELCDKALGRAE